MQLLSVREQCCACRGYILGGMLWFAVPFSMATTIGLAGLALDLPMSASEIGQALVPPAVAYHLMGKVNCMRSTPCVITDPFLSWLSAQVYPAVHAITSRVPYCMGL